MLWRDTSLEFAPTGSSCSSWKKALFDLAEHLPEKDVRAACQTRFTRKNNSVKVTQLDRLYNHTLENRFVKTLDENPSLTVKMVFHGTNSHNHKSIKKTGLCVPSHTSGVRVVNGAVHGTGIYTSECPIYSLSYCRNEPKMFVCAVITGNTQVSKHGVIHVVKKDEYVLPLYLLTFEGYNVSSYAASAILPPVVCYLQYWGIVALVIVAALMVLAAFAGFVAMVYFITAHEHRIEYIYFEWYFSTVARKVFLALCLVIWEPAKLFFLGIGFFAGAALWVIDFSSTCIGKVTLYVFCLGFDLLGGALSMVASLAWPAFSSLASMATFVGESLIKTSLTLYQKNGIVGNGMIVLTLLAISPKFRELAATYFGENPSSLSKMTRRIPASCVKQKRL